MDITRPLRRVVVTGLGVVSAVGPDVGGFWSALRDGCSGIAPMERADPAPLRFRNGAEARAYDPAAHFAPKELLALDRFAQFALVAAREALADADLAWTSDLRARTAVITGSCTGGQDTQDEGFVKLYVQGGRRVAPLTVPRTMANAGASHISIEHGLRGPAFTVASACSSASHAVGQAFWMVRSGLCDAAVTGGSEAPFSYGNLKAWEALRVVSDDTCRPFSADRSGLILGEGGAMLVLEPLEAARRRGARIYGEVVGFGMSADAHHLTQPSADGAALAMAMALRDARLSPEDVGYVNAHGTGTRANDPMETSALRIVFGPHADHLAVSSTKSMHGHALGAAGALEGAATILALHHGLLPPTAHFTAPDPDCDLDVVPNGARSTEATHALSNSFAFGGLNAVLAFRAWRA